MSKKTEPQSTNDKSGVERQPYEVPAIIYEGLITTSSKISEPPESSGKSGGNADPANVFKSSDG